MVRSRLETGRGQSGSTKTSRNKRDNRNYLQEKKIMVGAITRCTHSSVIN